MFRKGVMNMTHKSIAAIIAVLFLATSVAMAADKVETKKSLTSKEVKVMKIEKVEKTQKVTANVTLKNKKK